MNFHGDPYARVQWRAEDVQTLRPHWDLDRCEEELASVEKHLRDRTIGLGWDILDNLLPAETQSPIGKWS